MTTPVRLREHLLHLVLPESWVTIPLTDRTRTTRAVHRLVQRQFAGIDDQPLLRRDTEARLLLSAERAVAACGCLLAVSTMSAAGVPVPASLTVHHISSPPSETFPAATTLLDAVRDSLGDMERGEDPGILDQAHVVAGDVLRRVQVTDTAVDATTDAPASLIVDYWLTAPRTADLALLTFATPLITHGEAMLGLFDAVVASARWEIRDDLKESDDE